MATKNLSRTVIEGGRCKHYQAEVHSRIREERAETRDFLRAIENDPGSWDDCNRPHGHVPKRMPVTPCFDDKLRPIYRFLESKIGRNWDEVRSELFSKFDTRTTPGRHVLFDHLLNDVCEGSEEEEERYRRYRVDAQGRLEKIEAEPYRSRYVLPYRRENLFHVAAWLGHRKVGRYGAGFVWFVPTARDSKVCAIFDRYEIVYALVDDAGLPFRTPLVIRPGDRYYDSKHKGPVVVARCSFRQSHKLDAKDEAFFRKISPEWQTKILKMAPANV